MAEVALNLPFDCAEIREIAGAEFQKRLGQLSPIQGMKEFVKFELDFEVKIRAWRAGQVTGPVSTLAWGHVEKAVEVDIPLKDQESEADDISDEFASGDPNTERLARDMPLTVETTDGKGGKTRRKVRIKG